MEKHEEYYAKSENSQGHRETVKAHLEKVMALAREFGCPLGLDISAALAGQVHDFGKYSQAVQEVLRGTRTGVDHAMGGACFLEAVYRGSAGSRPVIEAVNGHHDGLTAYDTIRNELHAVADPGKLPCGNGGKEPAIENRDQLTAAAAAFRRDFPDFRPPRLPAPPAAGLESMLYTRMLFSCLVDADYTASALSEDGAYLARAEDDSFELQALLEKLYAHRDGIRRSSRADRTLNACRDRVFQQCGRMGEEPEGLYTLTAPTGTGKTLALLHFALRHCLKHGKRRIIIVLPFLTLAEQSAGTYAAIVPNVLIDHSQSGLAEEARELAARWSAPVIITTSVRFFEALFSDRPTDCRKLHNIAGSVVLFDEAQSLPAGLATATLRAVNELCGRYHTTMVFSTATQPDFSARKDLNWRPTEILPDHRALFAALQRVRVEWRLGEETPLAAIDARSFGETAAQYRLIANAGAQVIIPYAGERALYGRVAGQLREQGASNALRKEAAPITMTCFARDLARYAEEIPLARHGRGGNAEQAGGSGLYLLRPQYETLYDPLLGLHLPQEEQSNWIF